MKPKNTSNVGQKSITSFLFKTKKPEVKGRKKFLAEKVLKQLGKTDETNIFSEEKLNYSIDTSPSNNVALEKTASIHEDNQQTTEFTHEDPEKCKDCGSTKERLKDAKILLKKSSQINLKKDLTIESLKQKLQLSKSTDTLFADFQSSFNFDDMKVIRSVQAGPRKDSTFINRIMSALYKGPETTKLFNRSAAGRKHSGIKKDGLTPEKKEIIRKMFLERLSSEMKNCEGASESELVELEERAGKLNRYLRSAIANILSAFKKVNSKKPSNIDASAEPTSANNSSDISAVAKQTTTYGDYYAQPLSSTKVSSLPTILNESINLTELLPISNGSNMIYAVEPTSANRISNISAAAEPTTTYSELSLTEGFALPIVSNGFHISNDFMPIANTSGTLQHTSTTPINNGLNTSLQSNYPNNYNWMQTWQEYPQKYWYPENEHQPNSYYYYNN